MRQEERHAMLAAAGDHWWYRGRRRIGRAELERLDLPARAPLLDAGCASGEMLEVLNDFGEATGVDPDGESVALAVDQGHNVVEAALPDLPFADAQFSACTCLDVLEHLPDDRAALAELARVTRPGGALLVTVPAYEALWSAHDEANEHLRRYRARTLKPLAERTGWRVERMTYFNSLLLPAAAAVRLADRFRSRTATPHASDLQRSPPALNSALEVPLRIEAALLRSGGRLPTGLSLLAVLRRYV